MTNTTGSKPHDSVYFKNATGSNERDELRHYLMKVAWTPIDGPTDSGRFKVYEDQIMELLNKAELRGREAEVESGKRFNTNFHGKPIDKMMATYFNDRLAQLRSEK